MGEPKGGKVAEKHLLTKFIDFNIVYTFRVDLIWRFFLFHPPLNYHYINFTSKRLDQKSRQADKRVIEYWSLSFVGSSNGRTADSGFAYRGSNPLPPA